MEELYQAHEYEMYIRDQTDEYFEYDYYEEPVILYDNQLEQIILNPNNPHYNELLSKKENDPFFQTTILLKEDGWSSRTSATRKAIYQGWCYAQQQLLLPSGG